MSTQITDETKTKIRDVLSSKGMSGDMLDNTVDEIIEKLDEPVQSILNSLGEVSTSVNLGRSQSIEIRNLLTNVKSDVEKILTHFSIK